MLAAPSARVGEPPVSDSPCCPCSRRHPADISVSNPQLEEADAELFGGWVVSLGLRLSCRYLRCLE